MKFYEHVIRYIKMHYNYKMLMQAILACYWPVACSIIILHSTKAHVRSATQQNGSQRESTIKTSGCV